MAASFLLVLAWSWLTETVSLLRPPDHVLLHTLQDTGWVETWAFAPDGATLASAPNDRTVRLWRVADGALLFTLQGGALNMAFAPDGATLASGSGKMVLLWRVADGVLLHTLQHTGSVTSVAFAPDGATLASASVDGTVQLWRDPDGALLHTLQDTGWVTVAFAPDGAIIASASADGTARLWRVADGVLLRTLRLRTGSVVLNALRGESSPESVAFSSDGATLVIGTREGRVVLWNLR